MSSTAIAWISLLFSSISFANLWGSQFLDWNSRVLSLWVLWVFVLLSRRCIYSDTMHCICPTVWPLTFIMGFVHGIAWLTLSCSAGRETFIDFFYYSLLPFDRKILLKHKFISCVIVAVVLTIMLSEYFQTD